MKNVISGDLALNRLSTVDLLRGIRERRFGPADIIRSCLKRIQERDAAIGAWTELVTTEQLLSNTLQLKPGGRLYGIPFGVKDVVDARPLRTTMGSKLYERFAPPYDGGIVGLLRSEGAMVLGKTATCEFAGVQPAPTKNPLDIARTPGGSSSGSAAAVADFMVPFALGTQTGGSVIRPATFCGVVGFKPTYGFYPIAGMKPSAHSFDTIGLITRSVGDVAVLHETIMGLEAGSLAPAKAPSTIGVFRTHLWETIESDAAAAFEWILEKLKAAGCSVREVAPPPGFEKITRDRAVINGFERARNLAGEWIADSENLGPLTRDIYERGSRTSGEEYARARSDVEHFRHRAETMFAEVDVLITPATVGEAPAGFNSTGDARLQELWTMLHMPALGLPAGKGKHSLPIGIQCVAARFHDADLVSIGQWIERTLGDVD